MIFEGFAAGMPVVATDLGGMSEFVRPGENGLLFSLDDADDLAGQLRTRLEIGTPRAPAREDRSRQDRR